MLIRVSLEGADRATTVSAVTVLMGLATRLKLARLYLCTDSRSRQGDLAGFLEEAFLGGVDIIQIREKNLDPDAELAALETARSVAQRFPRTIVCVNDSPKLGERFGADLLHLGQTDGSAQRAKKRLHAWALVGRSTHAIRETDRAIADDQTDYFCVGPVWATPTKPDYTPVGLDLVRHATSAAPPRGSGVQALVRHRRHRPFPVGRRDRGRRAADLRGPGDHRGGRSASCGRRARRTAAGGLGGRSGDADVRPAGARLTPVGDQQVRVELGRIGAVRVRARYRAG